jgi:Lrp/AsnC family leucine-responsive transcriptional regulator
MTREPKIQPADAKILDILQRDGRRSYAEIGSEVGMSGPSAHERVKKLEARGILRGFMAQVDPASVGLGVLAFMWVTQAPGSIADDITDAFAEIPEVEACHRIAGEGDYLLKIRASDTADLERIVRRVQTTRHVFRTETDVVFSTPFERRPLPILRDGGEGGKTAGGPGS